MNELMVEMLVEQEAQKLEMLVDLRGDSLYTIWLGLGNEGTKADFLVWLQGKTPVIGENGNWFIAGIDTGVKAQGNDGYTPQKGVDYHDGDKGEPFTFADFTPEQIEALKIKGDTGVGIDYISLTSTNGKVKTYTITFDDLRTTTFDVTDGADGHSPVISFVGTTIYIDGVAGVDLKGEKGDTGLQGIQGVQGVKGDTGKSAYQIYTEQTTDNPVLTENQWGNLMSGILNVLNSI